MPKCLISKLDSSIKLGSKVEIADYCGNVYLGFVRILNRSDGRISLGKGFFQFNFFNKIQIRFKKKSFISISRKPCYKAL
jgi:hypothetical protein